MKKIVKLILIIIWMFTIFSFSSDNSKKSTKKSDTIIIKISEVILNHKLSSSEREKYIDKYVLLVRKGAHFTVYLILGLLLISFIKEYRVIDYKSIILAILISFFYASSDEIHQLFVVGRSCEFLDILLDTLGSSVGCFIYFTIYKIIRRKNYE